MNHPLDDAGGLTPDQRDKIVELAKLFSRSPRAPEIFVLLAELWVNARGSQENTAGFVTRKHLVEQLKDPFSLQALCKLLRQWAEWQLVEIGPAGLRAGLKVREVLGRTDVRFNAVQAQGSVLSPPAQAQPPQLSSEPHRPEIVEAAIESFVAYASFFNNMPRSMVYRRLKAWTGPRNELADCLCGVMAALEHEHLPQDPFATLDEMRRGVSSLRPMNAETFMYFNLKQIEAQRAETAQKPQFDASRASSVSNAIGPQLAEILAKVKAELAAAENEQQSPPAPASQEPNRTLKAVPQSAAQNPVDMPWGQPRPLGSDPAA